MDNHKDELNSSKVCRGKCKERKPLIDFYRNRRKRDGHNSICKKCELEKKKNYRGATISLDRMRERAIAHLDRSKRENFIYYMRTRPGYFSEIYGCENTLENINREFDGLSFNKVIEALSEEA